MSQTMYGMPNSFCWAELFTSDKNKSKDFYEKIFSWTYTESPAADGSMSYTHAMIAEGAVAGMMEINDELKNHGVVPYWNSYIAVKDMDKVFDLALKNGAKVVMPVTDVPKAGRMAMIQDPMGAHVSLWESSSEKPAPAQNCHGMVGWNELLTTDLNTAKIFIRRFLVGTPWKKLLMAKPMCHLPRTTNSLAG